MTFLTFYIILICCGVARYLFFTLDFTISLVLSLKLLFDKKLDKLSIELFLNISATVNFKLKILFNRPAISAAVKESPPSS